MPIAGTKLVTEFQERFKTKTGRDYYVNAYLLNIATRLGKFYTPTQAKNALDFYFKHYSDNNLRDFCNNIDTILKEYDLTIDSGKKIDELIKDTKRRMKKIYDSKSRSSPDNESSSG